MTIQRNTYYIHYAGRDFACLILWFVFLERWICMQCKCYVNVNGMHLSSGVGVAMGAALCAFFCEARVHA